MPFDAATLAAMKPRSYLINIARGNLIVEQALHDALTSGHLRGYAAEAHGLYRLLDHIAELELRIALLRALGRGGSWVPRITRPVEHGDVLELVGREWFVLHTPGHTPEIGRAHV